MQSRIKRLINVLIAVFKLDWCYTVRYKGWFLFLIIFPVMFSVLPIFLGRSVAGGSFEAAQSFEKYTGTPNYIVFMVIGSSLWVFAISSLWGFGGWLREQQMSGTLEQLLVSPANIFDILIGDSIFNLAISGIQFILCLLLGSAIFGQASIILNKDLLGAVGLLIAGLLPMYGLSMAIGGVIIRIKEAGSIMNILQMLLGFIMGIFYPITLLPATVRIVSVLFPLTVVANDIRAILLSTSYLFSVKLDLVLLALYSVIYPLLGFKAFDFVLDKLKMGEGIGSY